MTSRPSTTTAMMTTGRDMRSRRAEITKVNDANEKVSVTIFLFHVFVDVFVPAHSLVRRWRMLFAWKEQKHGRKMLSEGTDFRSDRPEEDS